MDDITVRASKGGRPLTLDPIMERTPLHVQPVRVESSIAAGFRVDWLTFTDEASGRSGTLSAGAGVGSPYMVLTMHDGDGNTLFDEVVDIRPLAQQWIDDALAANEEQRTA